MTDAAGNVTHYAYTALGQLGHLVDPGGNSTFILYKGRGDKIALADPDLGQWIYDYTVYGEVAAQTDSKCQVESFVYDQLGRPVSRTEDEGTTSWHYCASLGLLKNVTGPTGYVKQVAYDAQRRRAAVTRTIAGTAYTVGYSYYPSGSATGKLATVTYPASVGTPLAVTYQYDAWGALHTVTNATTAATYYTFNALDAAGRATQATLGNGLVTQHVYSAATGRIEALKTGPSVASPNVQQLSYAWDAVGNLTSRSDANQAKTETFSYDALNRIDEVKLNGQPTLSLSYGPVGNITNKFDVGTYTYGAGNAGPHAVTSISGTRAATYQYDANGNQTSRSGTTTTLKQYIYAGSEAIAMEARSAAGSVLHYLHRDSLGSVTKVTSASGTVEASLSFDAFGKRRNPDWSADPAAMQM